MVNLGHFSQIKSREAEIPSVTLQRLAFSIFDYQPENVHDKPPPIPMVCLLGDYVLRFRRSWKARGN